MGDRICMSISADSPSDKTLNRGPLALLLRRHYEFPFGINFKQFTIFKFFLPYSVTLTFGQRHLGCQYRLWDVSKCKFPSNFGQGHGHLGHLLPIWINYHHTKYEDGRSYSF